MYYFLFHIVNDFIYVVSFYVRVKHMCHARSYTDTYPTWRHSIQMVCPCFIGCNYLKIGGKCHWGWSSYDPMIYAKLHIVIFCMLI